MSNIVEVAFGFTPGSDNEFYRNLIGQDIEALIGEATLRVVIKDVRTGFVDRFWFGLVEVFPKVPADHSAYLYCAQNVRWTWSAGKHVGIESLRLTAFTATT